MISRNLRHSILMVVFPFALFLQGCSAMAPSYMDDMKATLVTNGVPPGSDRGSLEDVHRLYRNRQYAEALDGANYLLHNNSLSYNDQWVEFRETYLLRYRANVASGNYEDARRDYEALSALDWFEPLKVSAYLAVVNALEGGDTSTPVNRLATLAQPDGTSQAMVELPRRAEANYFQGVVAIVLGQTDAAKAHFELAHDQYRQLVNHMDGRSGLDTYVTAANSYLSIIETYLAVLSDISEENIARLAELRADEFYDPVAGGMIVKNWNWDMPYDPFLLDTSMAALENWSFMAGEGSEQMIAQLLDEGSYEEAYALVGRSYRSARMDDTVHQIAGIMSAYTPTDMTEEARRYLAQANVYIERRDYRQGAAAYLQVIEQSPWVVDAYYNLSQIYAAAEDYSNAIRTMQHFLILSPDSPRSREARDSIYTWEVSGR